MARIRLSEEQKIEQAMALFRSGKSIRECDKLTGVNYKKIEREAKQRGLVKGDLSQLVDDMTETQAKFVTLCDMEKQVVTKEVDDRIKHIEFLNKLTIKNLSVMGKKIDSDMDFAEHKLVQETINKGAERLIGKEPELVINNAQQTNIEPIRFVRAQ